MTLGDPAGIGPEVVLKSLSDRSLYRRANPLVIGDCQALALRLRAASVKIRPVLNPAQARFVPGVIDILHQPVPNFTRMPVGRPSAASGLASFLWVRLSVELAAARLVQGLVHAPISKSAWKMAGIRYDGHTELLADLCGVRDIAMAIVSEPLRTVLSTRHIAFSQVPSRLKIREISAAAVQAVLWMRALKIRSPRIGVCALNPHAGEGGLFGREEITVIAPAVAALRKKFRGVRFSGPLPADSAYRDHREGLYDCLITQYHDQSLIPLKLFASQKLVNVSLGLPFARTSPGHGTAFDIAGRGRADATPMKEAFLTAARLCS